MMVDATALLAILQDEGDCCPYALVMSLDDSLLYKGDDFTHTDVRPHQP